MIKVLFVCLGNICRSPTAEGVFKKLVQQAKLQDRIKIDSAGTHAYHVGEAPDARAQEAARNRGIELGKLQGRQAVAEDMTEFDYVLAMDHENAENLYRICPEGYESRINLFLSYAEDLEIEEVPDPYFGGNSGFDRVLDMIEEASIGLLNEIRSEHNIK